MTPHDRLRAAIDASPGDTVDWYVHVPASDLRSALADHAAVLEERDRLRAALVDAQAALGEFAREDGDVPAACAMLVVAARRAADEAEPLRAKLRKLRQVAIDCAISLNEEKSGGVVALRLRDAVYKSEAT